jgi:uncharacterized protein with FMN-binding domain
MLSLAGKRVLLTIHIALMSIWLGSVLSMLTLFLLKDSNFTVIQMATVDKILFLIYDLLIMNISIILAITAVLFSVFTPWGFVKHYWIIAKWILLIILALLLMFFASPAVNGMAALADTLGGQVLSNSEYRLYEDQAINYTIIQLILITTIITISVFKPWGKRKVRKKFSRKIITGTALIFILLLSGSVIGQYSMLSYYRNLPIKQINLDHKKNGNYHGVVNYGYDYEVEVYVNNHRIENINFIKNRESHYAQLATGIKEKIIREQTIDVEAVTGATTSSRVLLKAVETALSSPKSGE